MLRRAATPEIPSEFPLIVDHLSVDVGGNRLLDDISLQIDPGEYVALTGPSGAGKTTLVNYMLGLCTARQLPQEGSVRYGEVSIFDLNDKTRTELRGRYFGYVFQKPLLNDLLTAEAAIKQPARFKNGVKNPALLDHVIDIVGVRNKLNQRTGTLSAGEQQRVSLVRALSGDPAVLVLDEPTSALDKELKKETNVMLRHLAYEIGKTVMVITHEETSADRIITLTDGRIVNDGAAGASADDSLTDHLSRVAASAPAKGTAR